MPVESKKRIFWFLRAVAEDKEVARQRITREPRTHETARPAEGLAQSVAPAERRMRPEPAQHVRSARTSCVNFSMSALRPLAHCRDARPHSLPGELCASLGGLSLHAKVALGGEHGCVVYRLRRHWT